jgi:hypothetical protein
LAHLVPVGRLLGQQRQDRVSHSRYL